MVEWLGYVGGFTVVTIYLGTAAHLTLNIEAWSWKALGLFMVPFAMGTEVFFLLHYIHL